MHWQQKLNEGSIGKEAPATEQYFAKIHPCGGVLPPIIQVDGSQRMINNAITRQVTRVVAIAREIVITVISLRMPRIILSKPRKGMCSSDTSICLLYRKLLVLTEAVDLTVWANWLYWRLILKFIADYCKMVSYLEFLMIRDMSDGFWSFHF